MNGVPARTSGQGDLLVVFNADDAPIEMVLPPPPEGATWRRVFDTGCDDPGSDVAGEVHECRGGHRFRVGHRSTVLLESRATTPDQGHA
jgi:hypothetical protein